MTDSHGQDSPPPSPRLVELSWSSTEVEEPDGERVRYKDAKLFPGGSRSWDWSETGTSHTPGTQVSDVKELVKHGADVVVLSRGINGRLGVRDETLAWLEDRGVEVHVLQSEKAAARYEELRKEGAAVGGVFHSTC